MTSSKARGRALAWLLLLAAAVPQARAALGEDQGTVEGDGQRLQARRSTLRAAQYSVHELSSPDGSRVRQFVGPHGRVFAVSWNTLHKPDLSGLLGTSFADYRNAARHAADRGGIQRQFRHTGTDLVVQNSGHLQVYAGYAYRPSLLPAGLTPQALGL